jgi:hypothetical protein
MPVVLNQEFKVTPILMTVPFTPFKIPRSPGLCIRHQALEKGMEGREVGCAGSTYLEEHGFSGTQDCLIFSLELLLQQFLF